MLALAHDADEITKLTSFALVTVVGLLAQLTTLGAFGALATTYAFPQRPRSRVVRRRRAIRPGPYVHRRNVGRISP